MVLRHFKAAAAGTPAQRLSDMRKKIEPSRSRV
jgi:hypothetical protein